MAWNHTIQWGMGNGEWGMGNERQETAIVFSFPIPYSPFPIGLQMSRIEIQLLLDASCRTQNRRELRHHALSVLEQQRLIRFSRCAGTRDHVKRPNLHTQIAARRLAIGH